MQNWFLKEHMLRTFSGGIIGIIAKLFMALCEVSSAIVNDVMSLKTKEDYLKSLPTTGLLIRKCVFVGKSLTADDEA